MNLHELGKQFSKDYYEDGIRQHISGYEDFHFIPTRSFPEAVSIRDGLRQEGIRFESAIDYGCAKGFLVYALNMLEYPTIGVDISSYAVTNCYPDVRDKIHRLDVSLTSMGHQADLLIAKDVLEHVPEEYIPEVFEDFRNACNHALLVIPLGDEDRFRIREYEIDVTHCTRKDEAWWIRQIHRSGFRLQRFDYQLGAVKEKWRPAHPYGNGFFVLENPTRQGINNRPNT